MRPVKSDKPPPYTENIGSSTARHVDTHPIAAPTPPDRLSEPRASVAQVHLSSGGEPLSGTFCIDPEIPSYGLTLKKKNKKLKKNDQHPHASFQTRKGDINLTLATVGNARRSNKANVYVGSQSGNIYLRLLSLSESKPRIGLEIDNTSGQTQVYLPRSFCGAVRLSTKKGSIQILPALTAAMQTLKFSDREAFVLFGATSPHTSRTGQVADLCEIHTRAGKIIVGIDGEDKYDEPKGFWRKLGALLRKS
ncbi:hypothetical protein AX16_001742 [Volvariella volvacea WC 439]|nr:hypothetical protein AX16_001742 [Volvariella volvacea WC 439]